MIVDPCKALELLEKDKKRNMNIINFMRSYPVQTCDAVGDSVLVRGRSDEDWVYISSESESEFLQLAEGLGEEDKCFAILEDWMLDRIAGNKEVSSRLTSIRLVYNEKTALPPLRPDISRLSADDAAYVFENSSYKDYISIDYIEERLNKGIGLGIRIDSKLAAWAITHDDGAIGFLTVLEQYRSRGFGTGVTAAMADWLLKHGEIPFVHIEEENIKSMNLASKLGFERDRRIHWIKLR